MKYTILLIILNSLLYTWDKNAQKKSLKITNFLFSFLIAFLYIFGVGVFLLYLLIYFICEGSILFKFNISSVDYIFFLVLCLQIKNIGENNNWRLYMYYSYVSEKGRWVGKNVKMHKYLDQKYKIQYKKYRYIYTIIQNIYNFYSAALYHVIGVTMIEKIGNILGIKNKPHFIPEKKYCIFFLLWLTIILYLYNIFSLKLSCLLLAIYIVSYLWLRVKAVIIFYFSCYRLTEVLIEIEYFYPKIIYINLTAQEQKIIGAYFNNSTEFSTLLDKYEDENNGQIAVFSIPQKKRFRHLSFEEALNCKRPDSFGEYIYWNRVDEKGFEEKNLKIINGKFYIEESIAGDDE